VIWEANGLSVRVYDRESEIALELADRVCRDEEADVRTRHTSQTCTIVDKIRCVDA